MTEKEKVVEDLKKIWFFAEGFTPYISFNRHDGSICLDGNFSVEELNIILKVDTLLSADEKDSLYKEWEDLVWSK